jgi:hypothetical protein
LHQTPENRWLRAGICDHDLIDSRGICRMVHARLDQAGTCCQALYSERLSR